MGPVVNFQEELLKRWWDADPFRPTDDALRYYGVKHHIAARLQPRSICEIGVRAGYSAFAFLAACPHAEFLGVDQGTDGVADVNEASYCATHAQKILKDFKVDFLWRNTRWIEELPATTLGMPFEFVHIDADHSFVGCSNDLMLASRATFILVDDFDVGPEVRAACREFLLGRPGEWIAEYIPDGFRGNLLLINRIMNE